MGFERHLEGPPIRHVSVKIGELDPVMRRGDSPEVEIGELVDELGRAPGPLPGDRPRRLGRELPVDGNGGGGFRRIGFQATRMPAAVSPAITEIGGSGGTRSRAVTKV